MSLSFNEIPLNLRVAGAYLEVAASRNLRGLVGMPLTLLVIGQKLSTGTQAPLVPVQITQKDQAKLAFGAGAQLTHMIEKALDANKFVEVTAIAQVDLPAGATASGSITVGGVPGAAGTLSLLIGGRPVRVGVALAQTSATIATAIVAAINALPDLAVTAAVDGTTPAKVNITARHKGEAANTIDLRVNYNADERLPAGVTLAFAPMSGGTGNPDVTAVFDAIGDAWYTDIVMAYSDNANVTALHNELKHRFTATEKVDGHGYVGLSVDTHAALVTKGKTQNSQFLTFAGMKKLPNPAYEWAAVTAVQCAFYSNQDPARPLRTIPMTGLLAPAIADRFTLEENNMLLYAGVSVFDIDNADNITINRMITTYRENAVGAPDTTYLNLSKIKSYSFIRYDAAAYIATCFPRFKLANDGTAFARGQAVVTPSVIRSALINRALSWVEQGIIENIEGFKDTLIVERDPNDGDRVNSSFSPDIVGQFNVFAAIVEAQA